ncbi:MAG: YceI family protein [Deltaproteobacteria bacterium]|nr:YceI family protein [Deltaproteobacteria bacterium]MBI3294276.1 YceI family protein [Deltaproteobacteria bacterium]
MIFLLLLRLALAETYNVTDSKVSFLAVGKPAMVKIRGEGKCLSGTFKLSGKEMLISADCDLNKLSTGIDMRDGHMKEKYLETGKPGYALAHFEGSVLYKDGKNPFQGKMKLHGEERPITGEVTVKGTNMVFEWKSKVSDHKIAIPEYLGVKVADEVTVTVTTDGALQ